MDQVDDDVDLRAAAGGLSADEVQLVLGPVDEDDPGPRVERVAGPGLVERGGDHVGGVLADGPGQPPGPGLRAGPERAGAVAAAGRGDHVVRAAPGWLGVVDGDQGGHSLAVRLLPGPSLPGAHLPSFAAAFAVAARSAPGRITTPLAVGRQDHQHRRRARLRDPGGVERGDIGGGVHDGLLDLPLADDRPAPAGNRRMRGVERAAGRLQGGEFREGTGVPSGRQRQGGVGGAVIGRPRPAPGAPGHRHRAEQRGQQPAVPGLQPGPGDPVRPGHRGALLPGLPFFPYRPQAVVVLHQLAQDLPAPLVHEFLQLEGGHPRRGGAGELGRQGGEHASRDGERIIRRDRGSTLP